jgi:DnaJ-class molecular chaperone
VGKFSNFAALKSAPPDHYAALGLHRRCTGAQIRAAYRVLAKQHHPDVNGGSRTALTRTQELNAAHEILSDPTRRDAYDAELAATENSSVPKHTSRSAGNFNKEVFLRLEEFLRGTRLDVRVNDPSQPDSGEAYELVVPPETAPGARFKISRNETFGHGFIFVRVKARPDFRFKPRGSDLRCDLKISFQRALQGGVEPLRVVSGNVLRVPIPKKISRGEIVRLAGEGLPKPRGGRGDLLVRVLYRVEVRIVRAAK